MTPPLELNPDQGEVPRSDTITEAMESSQKGTYLDCPPKDPATGSKWNLAQEEVPRPDNITETMGCSDKGTYLTALQKIQQAAERVRCRYLHPTNGQKKLTPWLN